jgi:eukaryotic-like serine/threonine-protein kinase
MDLIGAEFGDFEVWGSISQGGMSRVWLARHRELSTPVVLKTLLDAADREGTFDRLRNEARLMARIPSARVVRAVDVGRYHDYPYLAQEYVDGVDLAELDRRRRATLRCGLPLWFVCDTASTIAAGLQSAHQTGVLHRDVKPSNLFGSPQTGIRLGDFGIAMARGLKTEKMSGTLRFVAPEALLGETPTRRGHVYSLGATAYDLYYGTPPFTTLSEILHGAPLRFPRARSAEKAYFQHVIGRMLARDPMDRFPSMRTPMRLLGPLGRSIRLPLHCVALGVGDFQLGSLRVTCRLGDTADAETEGIVNSANDEMSMQRGVSGALRRRAGQALEDEARAGGRRALGDCFAPRMGRSRARIRRSTRRCICLRSPRRPTSEPPRRGPKGG